MLPGQPPYPIAAAGLRLGRASDSNIVVVDEAVSWQHAVVQVINGLAYVTDLNSTNGTFVDEQRVPANIAYPLSANQTLRLGASRFVLTAPDAAQGAVQAAPRSAAASVPASRRDPLPFILVGTIVLAVAFVGVLLVTNRPANPGASNSVPLRITATATFIPPTATSFPPASSFTATSLAATTAPGVVRSTARPTSSAPRTQPTTSAAANPPGPTVVPSAASPLIDPLAASVESVLKHIQGIGGGMDRLYRGSAAEACAPLLADYYGVTNAPTYNLSGQPANIQTAYNAYRQAISLIADKINPIREVCESGGGNINKFSLDTGRTAINDANNFLDSAFKALGR